MIFFVGFFAGSARLTLAIRLQSATHVMRRSKLKRKKGGVKEEERERSDKARNKVRRRRKDVRKERRWEGNSHENTQTVIVEIPRKSYIYTPIHIQVYTILSVSACEIQTGHTRVGAICNVNGGNENNHIELRF